MASDTSNSGHLSKGSVVTREDRPPGPVPMRHLTRLGDQKACCSDSPQGVMISKVPSVKGGW